MDQTLHSCLKPPNYRQPQDPKLTFNPNQIWSFVKVLPAPHRVSRPRGSRQYLQGGDALAHGLWVLAQKPLLVQELPVAPVAGRLEQPVVQDVLQALGQGAQDPLLRNPDSGIRVKPNALLRGRKRPGSVVRPTPPSTQPETSRCFRPGPLSSGPPGNLGRRLDADPE